MLNSDLFVERGKKKEDDRGICSFGKECEYLMAKYKKLNIEPKYVHEMTEFGFQQYLKYVPYSCLIDDLEYAFVGQIWNALRKDNASNYESHQNPAVPGTPLTFPLSDWKIPSIFDENDMLRFPKYKADLNVRIGKAGEDQFKEFVKGTKPFVERKIDRGFDIINTWKFKDTYLS